MPAPDRIPATPRVSLVIPAYNEERYLPRLLDTVDAARERFRGGADGVEVVVADNGSTDRTAEIARARGCHVVSVEQRMIAAVRNGGARAARGVILAFVDADTRIHPETFNAVEAALADPTIVGGATGVRLERWSPGIAVTYAVLAAFVWVTRMDTGVVFCRREDFERIGGYDESLLLAEDVRFLWDVKRLGWRRHQRLTRLRRYKALASMRKFDKHGDWHYFPMMARGFVGFLFHRESIDRFAERYWYGRQRESTRRDSR